MGTSLRCERCGSDLAGQAVDGQCGNCLLNFVLEQTETEGNLTVAIPGVPPELSRVRYFGDYELLEEIARGGMGVVYRARQVSLNRTVALKMILSGDFSSASIVQRFRAEAEAAARLDHPNIVPIYEIGQHEGQQYFSMPFLEGGTLTEAIAGRRFKPREAAELMILIARAVHFAHQHGIVHRDLKPGNILLDSRGEPHVADFGLAKLMESDSGLTHSQAVLGTPSYMAPEQAFGTSKQATTASDVYSLGAILYELLTHRPPFKADTAMNTLRLVMENQPASPHSLNSDLDRDIETICLKCLEKDPQGRYASADALAEDLQRWLSHHPILARPASPPEKVFKWARRRPAIASLIVAIHLVALAGLLGILWQSKRANSHAWTAMVEAKRANDQALKAGVQSKRAENELWNARFSEARALRIAGGSGARVQSRALLEKLVERDDLTESQQLALREEAIAQLALVDMELSTNWISKPSWEPLAWNKYLTRYLQPSSNQLVRYEFPSHRVVNSLPIPENTVIDQVVMSSDEQLVAARFRNGGIIQVWSLERAELILQSVSRGPDFWQLSFSPDNRRLMVVCDEGVVLHNMEVDGEKRILNQGHRVVWAAFSPDSTMIAVLLPNQTGEIWDAISGAVQGSFNNDFPADRIVWHPDGTRLVLSGGRGRLEMRSLSELANGNIFVSGPRAFSGHQGYIDRLVMAPDGLSLFTYGWDWFCISWDLVSGRPQLRDYRVNVSTVDSKGEQLTLLREAPHSESIGKLLRSTGFRTLSSVGQPSELLGISFSANGRLGFLSTQGEGDCLVWDMARNTEIGRVKGLWGEFSRDGHTLFTFERTANRVLSYDVSPQAIANHPTLSERGKLLYQGRPGENVNSGRIAPDGRTLVVAASHVIIFIDTQGEKPLRRWNRSAHAVEISSDGRWMAGMLHTEPAILWDLTSGRPVYTGSAFHQITLGGGKWFSVAGLNRMQLYKLNSMEAAHEPMVFRGSGAPPAVAFSPGGQIFAMVFDWTTVRLYETATSKHLATLTPPAAGQRISRLTFTPDGHWLAAAMDDGVTVGWELPVIRKELATLGLDWPLAAENKTERGETAEVKFDITGLFSSAARHPSTPKELLDLSAYYTSPLHEAWHSGAGNSDLAELPRGMQTLGGVRFDLRGLIQVGSSNRRGVPYPREARGIAVNLSCERLHFVHSAAMAFDLQDGTPIGSYIVHYEDGETIEIPIIFGRDVADWFSQENEYLPALTLAWSGENETSRAAGRTIRLFKSTWKNPRPKVPIRHFDFIVTHERAAPFLVAVTAD